MNTRIIEAGGYYFGNEPLVLKTLLGSCVSIVLWRAASHSGGMCHYLLPDHEGHGGGDAPGRFADTVMQLFAGYIRDRGERTSDYSAHLIGAGNMFPMHFKTCADQTQGSQEVCRHCISVACRNRAAAWREARKYGFKVIGTDLGGTAYRHLTFDMRNGSIAVQRPQAAGADTAVVRSAM